MHFRLVSVLKQPLGKRFEKDAKSFIPLAYVDSEQQNMPCLDLRCPALPVPCCALSPPYLLYEWHAACDNLLKLVVCNGALLHYLSRLFEEHG